MTTLEDLLEIERDAVNPSSEQRERTARRLAAALGAGVISVPSSAIAASSATAAPSKLAALFGAKAALGWSAALIGIGAAIALVPPASKDQSPPGPPADSVVGVPPPPKLEQKAGPQEDRVQVRPEAREVRQNAEDFEANAPPAFPRGKRESSAKKATSSENAPSTTKAADPEPTVKEGLHSLQRDARLLSQVTSALNGGRHQEALTLMNGKETFRSALATEFSAARAVALCGLGRRVEGNAQVASLKKRAPNSPTLLRVKRACSE